ncbi:MAG: EpsD family peptidyl-prolyl cis-trans isomerase [Pseudomonadota bacterium]
MNTKQITAGKRLMLAGLVLAAVGLTACGKKDAKPGQALASVNGSEITVLQLNEELQRAGVAPAQQEAASKQLLQSLIDRQLLQDAAIEEKIDRDPKVVQALERAKALIVAQAYIQKRLGAPSAPTKAEVEAYFQQHPEFFSARKQFDMRQLVLASKDLDADAKAAIDGAKSLDEVAAWLDQRHVKFARTQISRTGADLAPELTSKLVSLPKGQLFIIREGERSVLVQIAEIKDSPVTLEAAAGQIQQYLSNKKNKDVADAEVARLRAAAKIVYLNEAMAPGKTGAAAAPAASTPAAPAVPAAASAEAPASANKVDDAQAARGVSGLK